jgi:hypothetical protein
MAEIEKLRAENARLRSESDAHTVLKEIYSNPDAPQANRIKAAAASLAHEKPRLMPQPAPLDLPCEEIEPLAVVVDRQRKRADAMQREARNIQVLPNGQVLLIEPNGNGDDTVG